MYTFLNSLGNNDGYFLMDLKFGQFVYKHKEKPKFLKGDLGYSMVYEAEFYRPKEDAFSCLGRLSQEDIADQFEWKTVYFDIDSELFFDDTMVEGELYEFPPFFVLGGQTYYAIYNQPKVLEYHYSAGWQARHRRDYYDRMRIDYRNIFTPVSILHNTEMYDKSTDKYFIDSREQVLQYFAKEPVDVDSSEWGQVLTMGAICYPNHSRDNQAKNFFKLNIHKPGTPVFYTSNVLELTVPIAEAVKELAERFEYAFFSLHNVVKQLVVTVEDMLATQVYHYYEHYYRYYQSAKDQSYTKGMPSLPLGNSRQYGNFGNPALRAVADKIDYMLERNQVQDEALLDAEKNLENSRKLLPEYETLMASIKKMRKKPSMFGLIEVQKKFNMLTEKGA